MRFRDIGNEQRVGNNAGDSIPKVGKRELRTHLINPIQSGADLG
jgi:hypothetical protein